MSFVCVRNLETMYYCIANSVLFFFFKQKTAYEMRISDWSSDVCSSDLLIQQPLKCTTAAMHITDKVVAAFGIKRSEERRVGKDVAVRVDLGGGRIIKKKK